MNDQYVAPKFNLEAFNCPYCGAYSSQNWITANWLRGRGPKGPGIDYIAISVCYRCEKCAIWLEDPTSYEIVPGYEPQHAAEIWENRVPKEATRGTLVHPDVSIAPMPHDDMPDDVRQAYDEARTIVSRSPRGAAALLRLCVQLLMLHLGEKGRNINDDIASLVKKGLPVAVQQSLDSLRVIGNNAVHPGQIDLNDNTGIALGLFKLLNFIIEKQISEPKQIAAFYTGNVPKSNQDGIKKRDGK